MRAKKRERNSNVDIYACSLVFLVWALWHGLDDPTCVRSLGVAILPYLHSSISTALMRPRRPKQYCLQLVIYIYIYIYIYALYPNISMHIPHTVLYTFPKVLILRLFLLIKWFFYSWWSFALFSDPNVWFKGDVVRRD